MSALKSLVDDVNALLSGFGLFTPRTAWLQADVTSGDLVWSVDANDSLGSGVAEIDDEIVFIRQFEDTSGTVTIAPDGRGWDSTTAAAHTNGTRVTIDPTFPRNKIARAINATIGRAYPSVWATGTTTFVANPAKATYELPAEVTSVIAVTTQTYGPSGVWLPIYSFTFDGHADTTQYPSGKTITVTGGMFPGRTVQVTYQKVPTALASDTVDFTDTGLSTSAREAIVFGTCASLMRFIDPIRLNTNSAQADELDSKKVIGRATDIANNFEQQFQAELVNEARRLRMQFPTRAHRRVF